MYAPVDANAARVPRTTASDNGHAVIIQVSRMEPLKGHAVLLDALAQLRDRAGWTCRLAGGAQRAHEAQYMESLRAQAAALGIADRVEFLGDRSDIPRLLACADIYCQPNIEPDAFGTQPDRSDGGGASGRDVRARRREGNRRRDMRRARAHRATRRRWRRSCPALLENRGHRERLGANGPQRARALCDPAAQMPRIADILQRAAAR